MTKEEQKTIAETILNQLGGNQFIAMTGAKNFTYSDKCSFGCKIMRNQSKANYIRINLSSVDLYDIEFLYITIKTMKTKATFNNIYNDQLRGLFERITGLNTSLTKTYT